jgi:hypothetical protein
MHAFDKHVEENGMPGTVCLLSTSIDSFADAKSTKKPRTSSLNSPLLKSRRLPVRRVRPHSIPSRCELTIGLDSIDKVKAQELAQGHVEQALDKSGHY